MEVKVVEDVNVKVLVMDGEKELAKATCFIQNTPEKDGEKIGTIGEFEINDFSVFKTLIEKCEEVLKEKGFKYVVAPMNGNTWKKYRTLKWTSEEPVFALENVDDIKFNELFLTNGFEELHTYTSTKGILDDAYDGDSLKVIEEKLKNENIVLRKFRKDNYVEDLRKIYNISVQSFGRNPLYTPISEEDFIGQYVPYIEMVVEELILIAEKDGKEVGFVFSVPNFNELKIKGKIESVILKTIAVLPEYQRFSIGNLMLNKISKIAKTIGFKEWIFAFMYSENTSQKMAKRNNTKMIREYALYGKEI